LVGAQQGGAELAGEQQDEVVPANQFDEGGDHGRHSQQSGRSDPR